MKILKNQKTKAVEVFSLGVAGIRGRPEKGSLPYCMLHDKIKIVLYINKVFGPLAAIFENNSVEF
jgi:hypothetical protein